LGPNGIIWQCLSPIEANVILTKLHDGLARGHYSINTTIKKYISSKLLVADSSTKCGKIMSIL
jgi:hypothetical protein